MVMDAKDQEKDGLEMCWEKYCGICFPGLPVESDQYKSLKRTYIAGWYDVLRILTSDEAQKAGMLDLAKNMELRTYQKITKIIEEDKKGNIDGHDK